MLKAVVTRRDLSELIKDRVVERRLFSKRIIELEIMGLVSRSESSVVITEAGEYLLKAYELGRPDPSVDPWINSAVIYALELGKRTDYVPREWLGFLRERGLWGDDGITEAGEYVLKSYKVAKPSIFLTPEVVEFLIALPPGPAPYDELIALRDAGGYGQAVVNALEAMRLLRIYPPSPLGSTYVLTPTGRRVKEALLKIPVYDSVISLNEYVAKLLSKDVLSEADEKFLEGMHLRSHGRVTEAGKDLLECYRHLGEDVKPVTPFVISVEEIRVLDAIKEFKINQPKGEGPTYRDLRDAVTEVKELGNTLHLLESKDLVRRVEVKGKDTYELTKVGEEVLRRFKGLRKDITSPPVKAATYALAGKPPKPEWVREGRELGIVFNDVTSRGYFIIEVSKRIRRSPYLTMYDTNIVHKTPLKGIKLVDLRAKVMESIGGCERDFERALSEAEGKGFIEVLPNDYVVLTEVGKLVKDVVVTASTQELLKAKVSITPTHYYILKTIKDNITKYKKVITESGPGTPDEVSLVYNNVKKYTSITTEEVKKVLHQLRAYALLGRTGVTSAGETLIKVGDYLRITE